MREKRCLMHKKSCLKLILQKLKQSLIHYKNNYHTRFSVTDCIIQKVLLIYCEGNETFSQSQLVFTWQL